MYVALFTLIYLVISILEVIRKNFLVRGNDLDVPKAFPVFAQMHLFLFSLLYTNVVCCLLFLPILCCCEHRQHRRQQWVKKKK